MLLVAMAVLVTVPLYWGLVPARARRPVFGVAATAALAWYAPKSVLALALLTGVVHLLVRGEGTAGRALACAAMLLSLAFLCAHKYLPRMPVLLGVSYATFRLVHLAVERARGKAPPGTLASTLEYVLFAPSFLAGPIEREPDFHARMQHDGLPLDAAFWAVRRILTGLVKKVLVVAPLAAAVDPAFGSLAVLTPAEAWSALFGYALVIYLDFSAYCDIALGVARLYGFVLSENFDWPYLAPSITAFWQRWHITLSSWLRDYIFLPLSVLLGRSSLRDAPVLTGACAAVVTMLACGLWHGDTIAFVLWGLAHGLASALHQAWRQKVIGALRARDRKALMASATYRVASTLLTFLFVSLMWPLFRLDVAGTARFWRRLAGL